MATTNTVSGTLAINVNIANLFTVDTTGQRLAQASINKIFDSSNIVPSGFFVGTAVCAAGDWLMAHATDPLGAMGDAAYSDGLTVASKKLKLLLIQNLDATNTITVVRKSTNGLTIFTAAGAGVTIQPGGVFLFLDPSGATSGALTTTSNDALTISVGGGTPNALVLAVYGT